MVIKLNVVDDNEKLLNKGDAIMYVGRNKNIQLAIVCPRCGRISASAGGHAYNKKTRTYHPSIVHDKKLGGCGWHGWLKNGIFTEC